MQHFRSEWSVLGPQLLVDCFVKSSNKLHPHRHAPAHVKATLVHPLQLLDIHQSQSTGHLV